MLIIKSISLINLHFWKYLYTTQVNSTFRTRWLASSEVISQVLFTSEQPKENKMAFVAIFSQIKFTIWAANYPACVVYTKTIIHLSVGESYGYLPPLRWIIVNYCPQASDANGKKFQEVKFQVEVE